MYPRGCAQASPGHITPKEIRTQRRRPGEFQRVFSWHYQSGHPAPSLNTVEKGLAIFFKGPLCKTAAQTSLATQRSNCLRSPHLCSLISGQAFHMLSLCKMCTPLHSNSHARAVQKLTGRAFMPWSAHLQVCNLTITFKHCCNCARQFFVNCITRMLENTLAHNIAEWNTFGAIVKLFQRRVPIKIMHRHIISKSNKQHILFKMWTAFTNIFSIQTVLVFLTNQLRSVKEMIFSYFFVLVASESNPMNDFMN